MKTLNALNQKRRLNRRFDRNSAVFNLTDFSNKTLKTLLSDAIYKQPIPGTELQLVEGDLIVGDEGKGDTRERYQQIYTISGEPVLARPYSIVHYLGILHGEHVAHVVELTGHDNKGYTGFSAIVNERDETLFNGWWMTPYLEVQMANSSRDTPLKLNLWDAYITSPGKPRLEGNEDVMFVNDLEKVEPYVKVVDVQGNELTSFPRYLEGDSPNLFIDREMKSINHLRFLGGSLEVQYKDIGPVMYDLEKH